MSARTYQRRPQTVEAVQWTGLNNAELRTFAKNCWSGPDEVDNAALLTDPHSVWEYMYVGDWAVRDGESLKRVDERDFASLYEV